MTRTLDHDVTRRTLRYVHSMARQRETGRIPVWTAAIATSGRTPAPRSALDHYDRRAATRVYARMRRSVPRFEVVKLLLDFTSEPYAHLAGSVYAPACPRCGFRIPRRDPGV